MCGNIDGEIVRQISFHNRFVSYYYDLEKEVFSTAKYQLGLRLDQMAKGNVALTTDVERKQLEVDFGRNIIQVPIRSKLNLFIAEVLSPFEVFQFYAIVLWLCE